MESFTSNQSAERSTKSRHFDSSFLASGAEKMKSLSKKDPNARESRHHSPAPMKEISSNNDFELALAIERSLAKQHNSSRKFPVSDTQSCDSNGAYSQEVINFPGRRSETYRKSDCSELDFSEVSYGKSDHSGFAFSKASFGKSNCPGFDFPEKRLDSNVSSSQVQEMKQKVQEMKQKNLDELADMDKRFKQAKVIKIATHEKEMADMQKMHDREKKAIYDEIEQKMEILEQIQAKITHERAFAFDRTKEETMLQEEISSLVRIKEDILREVESYAKNKHAMEQEITALSHQLQLLIDERDDVVTNRKNVPCSCSQQNIPPTPKWKFLKLNEDENYLNSLVLDEFHKHIHKVVFSVDEIKTIVGNFTDDRDTMFVSEMRSSVLDCQKAAFVMQGHLKSMEKEK